MLEVFASLVVIASAIYLICIAVVSFFAPSLATRFLDGFASSLRIHITEMLIRLLVGWSLVAYAPQMLYSAAFSVFGWILAITSVVLLLVPWRWHQRFARKAVRPLTRRVWVFGILALPLGIVILFAVSRGGAS